MKTAAEIAKVEADAAWFRYFSFKKPSWCWTLNAQEAYDITKDAAKCAFRAGMTKAAEIAQKCIETGETDSYIINAILAACDRKEITE